jgi:hypothetical protein
MKKLILIIFVFASLVAKSQDIQPSGANWKTGFSTSFGYYLADSTVWIYKGTTYGWTELASHRDVKKVVDSLAHLGYTKIEVNNLLSAKLNSADSLNKYVTPYYIRNYLKKSDTTLLVGTKYDLSLKQNKLINPLVKADTATLLATHYNLYMKLNTADTSWMLNPYAKNISVALKLNISDTSAMLNPYASKILVATKLNKSDTASMLNTYINNFKLNSALLGKLNISDTLAMLLGYNNRINQRLKLADTANMLLPYLKLADITVKKDKSDSVNGAGYYTNYKALSKADLVDGKVPLTQINDVLLGAVSYQGSYSVITNTPTLPAASGHKGWYYIVSDSGFVSLVYYRNRDWIVSNGTTWDKIDNYTKTYNNANSTTTGLLTSTDWTTFNNKEQVLTFNNGLSRSGNTITNSAPDQTVSLSNGTGITVTGTYPNFTITNSAPSSGGTVTSVSGTSPIVSSGGNTPEISINQSLLSLTKSQISDFGTYSTDIHSNITALNAVSGTNTGDNATNTLYSSLVSNATHTGDATGSTALTLATVNSNIGTYNNITINAKGLATAGSNVSYEPAFSKNTAFNKNFGTATTQVWGYDSHPTTFADYGLTTAIGGYLPLSAGSGQALTGTLYGTGAIFSGNINTNSSYNINGSLFANTYKDANSDGYNIWIGGGGQSSIGAVGTTYKGSYNTANGFQSLFSNTTGSYNTANGVYSLYSNTTGSNNTANGVYSLYSNTTGYSNTTNGYASLLSNTTGYSNATNGVYSLYSNTTGSNNTANGFQSLFSNTTGSNNTANGFQSLFSNTTGSNNTANGVYSLYSNTTGYSNTTNGVYSLYSNTTGSLNTALGQESGNLLSNGAGNINSNNSIFLGYNTKAAAANGVNEIVIGDQAIGNGSNTVTLGNNSVTNTYLKGIVNATQINPTNLTANYLPKMGTGGLVNSLISESGTVVTVGGSVTATGATFTTGAGSGKVWTSDGSGVGSWQTNSVPTLSSGTYTPTITNLYGTSSIVARESTYQQIGNIIHVKVTGQFVQTQINPSLSISLPFTRGSAQVNYPVGVGIVDVSGIITTARVMGETTTSIWLFYVGANISSNCDFAVEFDYSL